jgi:hypothetical protein
MVLAHRGGYKKIDLGWSNTGLLECDDSSPSGSIVEGDIFGPPSPGFDAGN